MFAVFGLLAWGLSDSECPAYKVGLKCLVDENCGNDNLCYKKKKEMLKYHMRRINFFCSSYNR